MFEDLVLKAQGFAPQAMPDYYQVPPKILTPFAYLAPMKFRIAEFLRDNPNSTAKEIRIALGILADTMSACVGNMFKDELLNRTEIKAARPHYSYTLAIGKFKVNTAVKRINKNETKALDFIKDAGEFTSADLTYQTSIAQKNIYYLMRTLVAKGLIKINNPDKSIHVFQITSKGRRTIEDGGIYEGK